VPYIKTHTTGKTALSRRTEERVSVVKVCELLVIFVILVGESTASNIWERLEIV